MSMIYVTTQQIYHYVEVSLALVNVKLTYKIVDFVHCSNRDIFFSWQGKNGIYYINRISHITGLNTSALYQCFTYNDMLDTLCKLSYKEEIESKYDCVEHINIKR